MPAEGSRGNCHSPPVGCRWASAVEKCSALSWRCRRVPALTSCRAPSVSVYSEEMLARAARRQAHKYCQQLCLPEPQSLSTGEWITVTATLQNAIYKQKGGRMDAHGGMNQSRKAKRPDAGVQTIQLHLHETLERSVVWGGRKHSSVNDTGGSRVPRRPEWPFPVWAVLTQNSSQSVICAFY